MPVLAGSFDSKEYAWKDISFSIFGGTIIGIQELTYKKTRTLEKVYGAGNEPLALNEKNKEYSGNIILLRSEFDKLNDAAQAATYDDVLDLPGFPVTISFSNDTKVRTHTLKNVKFTEFSDGAKQGDGFLTVTLPIEFIGLQRS